MIIFNWKTLMFQVLSIKYKMVLVINHAMSIFAMKKSTDVNP